MLSLWGCFPAVTFPFGNACELAQTRAASGQARLGCLRSSGGSALSTDTTRPHLISLGKNRAKKDEARGHESLGPCINHGSACAIGCKLLLWARGEKVPVPGVFGPILVFCLPDAGCNKSVLAFRSLPLAFCGP